MRRTLTFHSSIQETFGTPTGLYKTMMGFIVDALCFLFFFVLCTLVRCSSLCSGRRCAYSTFFVLILLSKLKWCPLPFLLVFPLIYHSFGQWFRCNSLKQLFSADFLQLFPVSIGTWHHGGISLLGIVQTDDSWLAMRAPTTVRQGKLEHTIKWSSPTLF